MSVLLNWRRRTLRSYAEELFRTEGVAISGRTSLGSDVIEMEKWSFYAKKKRALEASERQKGSRDSREVVYVDLECRSTKSFVEQMGLPSLFLRGESGGID
jgi:hypothetical protein